MIRRSHMGVVSLIGLFVFLVIVGLVAVNILIPIQLQPPSSAISTDFAFDKKTFLSSVSEISTDTSPKDPPPVIILPHHLTASPLIARGISMLVRNPPETIIILSPNHSNSGQCSISTADSDWNTPFGQVSFDKSVLASFIKSGSVCFDNKTLSEEHGIAGLLPFIKYYLPDTKIVPFIINKNIDTALFNKFSQQLISLPRNIPILSSVDFSHGLSKSEADKRDTITEKYIKSFRYQEILPLSSEFIDSPISLVLALKVIESLGHSPHFLAHTDSSKFNFSESEVTTYFLIASEKTKTASVSNSSFTIVFGGDVMLGRTVNTRIKKYSDNSWPFRQISSLLSSGDITVVNLESPFRSGCFPTDTGMIFCADPSSVEGLVFSGIDVVNIANNHIGNQKEAGLKETQSVLASAGIASIGQNTPYLKKIKGTTIAFLGFNDIPPYISEIANVSSEKIKTQIVEAKKKADLVIVTFHWGNEYSFRSSRQIELAHLAIDSGADAVIGHHPHWVQETEMYQGKPVYYSLGNLVFDQMWSDKTREGLIVKFTYSGNNLIDQETYPVKISDYGQPTRFSP